MGEGQASIVGGGGGEEDRMVDVEKVIERFKNETTRLRTLKPGTRKQYIETFRGFVKDTGFGQKTIRELRTKGKKIVLDWLIAQTERSILYDHSALSAVWTYGFEDRHNLPYPVNPKKDLPRPPKKHRGKTPKDAAVKVWVEAMKRDPKPLHRIVYSLIVSLGWRPEQVSKIKHRNLFYKESGELWGIVADGELEDFKRKSPIIAYLPLALRQELEEWLKFNPGLADQPIFPGVRPSRISRWFRKLRRKENLPPLTAKSFRHWVATKCDRSGMSKAARANLLGHDPLNDDIDDEVSSNVVMGDYYDNPETEESLKEQESCLPNGTLGVFIPPKVELVENVPEDALCLMKDYLEGRISMMDFVNKMEQTKNGQKFIVQKKQA